MRSLLVAVMLAAPCAAMIGCSLSEAGLEATPDGGNGLSAEGATSPFETGQPPPNGADSGVIVNPTVDAANAEDATSSSTGDTGSRDAAPPDAGPPDTGPCNGPCLVPPSGWTPVALLPMPSTSPTCPTGFGSPLAFVEGPTAGTGACACGGCNVTQAPSCEGTTIDVHFDTASSSAAGTCATMASMGTTPLRVTDGGCGTDLFGGTYANYDVKYTVSPAIGGTCAADGKATGSGVTYAARSVGCVAEAGACDGGTCAVPPSFQSCIMTAGAATCPAGPMTVRHLVGTGATVSCSTCTACTVSAGCTGTVSLYTDGSCKKMPYDVAADGHCDPIYKQMQTYNSYTFAADPPTNVTCQASGSMAQGVSLESEATVCCTP